LTVGEEQAQQIAETMIKGGIRAIWNFVPLTLKVPEEIIVENEVIAAGLAVLSKKLLTSLKQTP
jgi:redox-sensing transcriptional repressor